MLWVLRLAGWTGRIVPANGPVRLDQKIWWPMPPRAYARQPLTN